MDTSSTSPGQPVVQQIRVREKPDVVLQRIQAAGMGVRGYDITSGAPGTVVFTRKFWPLWVIIVAVVGILVALLGLLALLYREEETLTVSVREDGDGSIVDINGKAKPELVSQITNALSALSGYEVVSGGMMTPGVAMPAVAPAAPVAPAPSAAPASPPPPPPAAGSSPAPAPPGVKKADWNPDPTGRHELRYWDGNAWTEHVSDQGKTATDAV